MHLRTIMPGDALVAGLNTARAEVTAQRAERKKRKAVQVTLHHFFAAKSITC